MTTPVQQHIFPERCPTELLDSALSIIDRSFSAGATAMVPLFSGGHDSLSACFAASHHPRFNRESYHIDTTIGARETRRFVDETASELGWAVTVLKSNFSFEKFVTRLGFPGPGSHQWVYNKLKDRCVSTICKGRGKVALITGCRQQESTRRMGHVEPLKIGETSKRTGEVRRKNRLWCAPCFDWTANEQRGFMDYFGLPRNPIKESPLAMSGECFCGAFARPNEIALVRQYAPDVAIEIDRLSKLVPPGSRSTWGTRTKNEKGIIVAQTGPMCSSCDYKAAASGLLFEECVL